MTIRSGEPASSNLALLHEGRTRVTCISYTAENNMIGLFVLQTMYFTCLKTPAMAVKSGGREPMHNIEPLLYQGNIQIAGA